MSQKSGPAKLSSERIVRDIRRATRKQYSAEEKIRIVLDGLRGEHSVAELCRREGIAESLYYTWSMGIRDRPIAPRSPWQNGFAERLIGSIRRECLDHMVVFSEAHLRHLLRAYASYYNPTRTLIGPLTKTRLYGARFSLWVV